MAGHSLTGIHKTLRAWLLELDVLDPGALPEKREWPNHDFAPPEPGDGVNYLRESFMPAGQVPLMFRERESTGLYQISIFVPVNSGSFAAQTVVDKIVTHFAPGGIAPAEGGEPVNVDRSESGPGIVEQGKWWMVPASIFWRLSRPV
jgi:hypothetical protein